MFIILGTRRYGEVEIQLHAYLTSVPDGGELSGSRPGRWTSEERVPPPGTNSIRNTVCPTAGLRCCHSREWNKDFRHPAHPSTYTDWAITALLSEVPNLNRSDVMDRELLWKNFQWNCWQSLHQHSTWGRLFPSINYAKSDFRNRHGRRKYSCFCLRWGANYEPNATAIAAKAEQKTSHQLGKLQFTSNTLQRHRNKNSLKAHWKIEWAREIKDIFFSPP
jgi:hypothetical protein